MDNLSGLIKNTTTNQGCWMSNNFSGRMTVRSNYNENNHIIKGLKSVHKIVGLNNWNIGPMLEDKDVVFVKR